jgi:Xaa-Pro dipeptidase
MVLEPGMVVAVEPDLYRDGVGGFRHSDCVLLAGDGAEVLTDYPRDLENLSC